MKETVFFTGTILGEGHSVDCKVRATKTTLDLDPDAPPEFSGYDIVDSVATVKLPDGHYEVWANGEKIRCKLDRGRFQWRLWRISGGRIDHTTFQAARCFSLTKFSSVGLDLPQPNGVNRWLD